MLIPGNPTTRVDQIFSELVQTTKPSREVALTELRDYIISNADGQWEEDIRRHLLDLVQSKVVSRQLAAVLTIDLILDTIKEDLRDNRRNLYPFYNHLTTVLRHATDHSVIRMASKTTGKLVKASGGALGDHFLEEQIPRFLEMSVSDSSTSFAVVHVLKEFSITNTLSFLPHFAVTFRCIATFLRDPQLEVRTASAEFFENLLAAMGPRELELFRAALQNLVLRIQQGLKSLTPAILHGSILGYQVLFLSPEKELLQSDYLDTCEAILRFRSHADSMIRDSVISIIPAFASYDLYHFIEHIFPTTISFLIQRIGTTTSDAPTAYLSIGHLTSVVGEDMEPYINDIFHHAQAALNKQNDRNSTVKPDHIFKALSLMIRALGPTLWPIMNKYLELFFTCGLSEALVEMLHMAVRHIPLLLGPLQERLLNLLSIILSGQPFVPPGARQPHEKAELKLVHSPSQIILALNVLSHFDFKEHGLSEFVIQAVLPHLNNEDVNARKGAAVATCQILSRDRIRFQSSQHALETITCALDKLLSVAIVDIDPSVRKAALSSLTENLDHQLAQSEYIRLLFLALHDEVVDNRILAMGIIGRVINHNPAHVSPQLKKMLVQLLTELEYAITIQNKEDAIRLLAALVSSAHTVVEKEVLDVLNVLLACSTDSSVIIRTNVLICLGELAVLDYNEGLAEHLEQIMNIILPSLEGSSQIRSAALHCLGKICTHMSYVITPIEDYPTLLPLLHGMLKREQSASVRQQVIRVIGLLGALDPDRYQTRVQKLVLTELQPESINVIPDTDSQDTKAPVVDDPYQDKVVRFLLDILQQQALNSLHHLVVPCFVSIANARGAKFASTMPKIIPTLCTVIRNSLSSLQNHYLAQLTSLITAVKQHIRSCLKEVMDLINDLWNVTTQRLALIILVETLADVLAAEIGKYTAPLVTKLLLVLHEDKTEMLAAVHARAIAAIVAFGPSLQEHLNLVIPVIITCFRHPPLPFTLRKQAIDSLSDLSENVDLHPYASRIIHALEEVLADDKGGGQLLRSVVDAFSTFTYTLGPSMTIFIPSLTKIFREKNIQATELLELFSQLSQGHTVNQPRTKQQPAQVQPAVPARTPNANLLKQAWDVSRVLNTHESWISWFTGLSAQLVKESPSVSLQACMNLFDVYKDTGAELFSPALASCWKDLPEPVQEDFIHVIQHVVSFSGVPPEIAHHMLNLVEDMERNNTPFRISHGQMAEYCFNLNAYAKALHHRELQFFQDFAPSTIESLIEINAMLRQSDAALGTLNLARQSYEIRNPESWYEKLGQWSEALQLYQAIDNRAHMDVERANESLLGQLRCLHALGEWKQVLELTSKVWEDSDGQLRKQLAPLGAAGAWQIESWDELETYYSAIDTSNGDRFFYEAISCIQRNRLPNALQNVSKARDLLDPEFTSLLDESPDRLDRFAVQAQMISELEELVLYKKYADRPRQQQRLRETWKKRLLGCQKDINVWQRVLKVRSLSLKSDDDIETTVQFANLCRKSGRFGIAHRAMEPLVRSEQHGSKAPPPIVYAQLKIIWHNGERQKAFHSLRRFIQELSQSPQLEDANTRPAITHVLSRCYLKHGMWQTELENGLTPSNAGSILTSYHFATAHDPQWSKAWHTWALANLDMIRTPYTLEEAEEIADRIKYVVAAVEGFFRSLALRSRDNLPDTLNLLTLWFKYGGHADVNNAVLAGIKSATCAMWLDVVPQIIARIQTTIPLIRTTLTRLLSEIGKQHPQCLVYALNVAAKSPSVPRKTAATKILNHMCTHSRMLVEQVNLVERELSRVAVSWSEMWYEAIQKLARHYFAGNSTAILDMLQPLHEQLDAPSTPFEVEFKEIIGPHLLKAKALCQKHVVTGDKKTLDQAWSLYLRMYQQIEPHRPEIQPPVRGRSQKNLDLHTVSPALVHAMNLDLAVPGTYVNGSDVIRIAGFKTQVPCLPTKQRPRKLTILGDNGQRYLFLLKGFEDLRQDERVMQVFGLVNTLLARNRECLDRRLHLQRYSVVPLAPDAGLIGWIADIDPLQNLILEYRNNHGILPDLEHRLILQEEPDFDTTAPLPKKLHAFESALKRTTGQDLYRVFWLKSPNSEAWVTRRTTYTRSLAVGNMICYLLGIGDRHPGNIIIDRKTCKVIHIDFGDCFEVSYEREQLPEKVPFRLTRMLRHAMEVCGIQGGFKISCELSLNVFRENKESLLAVLEAFIYDPLINWRLVKTETHTGGPGVASSFGSVTNSPNRRTVLNEDVILADVSPSGGNHEFRNERALAVYSRVEDKLTGRDFNTATLLTVGEQVERLVKEATSNENLCQLFHGWCPFW